MASFNSQEGVVVWGNLLIAEAPLWRELRRVTPVWRSLARGGCGGLCPHQFYTNGLWEIFHPLPHQG